MSAHIFGLFLDPDDFASVRVLVDGGGNFRARQRIELVEEKNRGAGVFAAAALGAKLVADFTAGDEDALGVLNFSLGNDRKKTRLCEIVDAGGSVGMPQHAFGREDHERLAPRSAYLPAQQMKILRGGGGLANLPVFFARKLHLALHSCAGILVSLALEIHRLP